MRHLCTSPHDYQQLCQEIINHYPQGEILLIRGNLGAGKTTFVQTFIQTLGKNVHVDSPTFSVQNIYDEGLYHYDIYRKSLAELTTLGIIEEFDKQGWHFVEWGSDEFGTILHTWGYSYVTIDIDFTPKGRYVTINYA